MAVKKIKVNGRWVWQARVAYQGLRKSTIRETKPEAKIAEGELLQSLKNRAGKQQAEAERPATLRTLFEIYAQDLATRGKGADTIGRAVETAHVVERLMPELLDKAVTAIGDIEIFAFRNARSRYSARAEQLRNQARKRRNAGDDKAATALELAANAEDRNGTKPSTINRDLRTLRAALKKARPDYRFPAGAFFREDETRVRWLRPEEELLVLETMRSPFREIAKLAALTLMRLSEIRTLRREWIHLEQGVVMLPRAKSGARPVILNGDAQKLLRGQFDAHSASEWVFPGPDGRPYERSYVSRIFRKAARAAGLRDFTFHDLRHHGATMALNRGFTAPIVMALGGWKTERMMRRYAAVTDQTLRAAAEAVAGNETWQQSVKSVSEQMTT